MFVYFQRARGRGGNRRAGRPRGLPARNANVRNAEVAVEEDLDLRFLPNMQEEAEQAARMTVWKHPEVLHALVQAANAYRDILKGIRPKNKPPGGEWMKRTQGWEMIASKLSSNSFRICNF